MDSANAQRIDELEIELRKERELREHVEEELRETQAELDEIRRYWKQATRELDKLQRQGQQSGFYQITDNYLIQLINVLRYNINNLAVQYFSEPSTIAEVHGEDTTPLSIYLRFANPRTAIRDRFLNDAEHRPTIIKAFMWKVLVTEIYGKLRWAGRSSFSLWSLQDTLKPKKDANAHWSTCADTEAERKYNIWRATTVNHVLDAMDEQAKLKADEKVQQWKRKLVENIEAVIGAYRKPHAQEGYEQQLLEILDEWLNLDKEISRQTASVEWLFQERWFNPVFDPSTMVLEKGEAPPKEKQHISLVTSPGVVKRGKSTGEDFENVALLLPMEVSCWNVA
ncbi:hypothetical protein K491DRAFT_721680 [Lophiostoma macrostomum CBS 122681]|uniref:Uncharacterized protein n=1 Tax=Lophiostoma macrostomum CBS 122681 TaxID=1314788 RepID=A0A6A6SS85_9PLEO|nr:hypothetical protein K491DRAFT_721680 [Lophiostoma macrostomum CBS 122681]